LLRCTISDPGPRQQLAQVQVALPVLHQQQQPGGGSRIARGGRAFGFEPEVGAEQRLHAFLAGGVVELDGTEEIGQVGDGHGGLAVPGCGLDRVIDPQGAIDDGVLGVGAQVDEVHLGIVGRRAAPAPDVSDVPESAV